MSTFSLPIPSKGMAMGISLGPFGFWSGLGSLGEFPAIHRLDMGNLPFGKLTWLLKMAYWQLIYLLRMVIFQRLLVRETHWFLIWPLWQIKVLWSFHFSNCGLEPGPSQRRLWAFWQPKREGGGAGSSGNNKETGVIWSVLFWYLTVGSRNCLVCKQKSKTLRFSGAWDFMRFHGSWYLTRRSGNLLLRFCGIYGWLLASVHANPRSKSSKHKHHIAWDLRLLQVSLNHKR